MSNKNDFIEEQKERLKTVYETKERDLDKELEEWGIDGNIDSGIAKSYREAVENYIFVLEKICEVSLSEKIEEPKEKEVISESRLSLKDLEPRVEEIDRENILERVRQQNRNFEEIDDEEKRILIEETQEHCNRPQNYPLGKEYLVKARVVKNVWNTRGFRKLPQEALDIIEKKMEELKLRNQGNKMMGKKQDLENEEDNEEDD